MKKCMKCRKNKEDSEFHNDRRTKDGLHKFCKNCHNLSNKGYWRKHRERYLERIRITRLKRIDQWRTWLIEKYGISKCSICNKELGYLSGNRTNSVYFDHRHTYHTIKINPSVWLESHDCSEKNKKIWIENDFGILCGLCNQRLPTENRDEWLGKITKYISGEKDATQHNDESDGEATDSNGDNTKPTTSGE